nr:hypothetical protein [Chloroflexia bacterium]
MLRSNRLPPRFLLIALPLILPRLLLGGIGPVVAQQTLPVSPATGHASVIANGVTELAAADVAWRVTYRTADPLATPIPAPAAPAFLVGESGEVLVAAADGQRTLLLAGEARFSQTSSGVEVSASGGDRGAWFEIALPAAAEAEEHGDGIAVFTGASFAAPAGERDLDLVRDVLAQDETTTVIGQESPVLLLATGGTLRVEATDGSSATLRVGQAGEFGGDLVVSGDSAAPASFVAGVVGTEVSADDAAAAPPAAQASPVAGGGQAGVGGPGVIAATVFGCPADIRPRQLSADACELDPAAVELELVALDGQAPRSLGSPQSQDQGVVWSGLPLGVYAVRAAGFGPGFSRVLVPGAEEVRAGGSSVEGTVTGYEIVLDESTAESSVEIYALGDRATAAQTDSQTSTAEPMPEPTVSPTGTPMPRSAATATPRPAATPTPEKSTAVAMPRLGSISLRVWSCPDSLATFNAARCVLASAPYDVTLAPETGGAPLLLANASLGAGGEWVWEGVTFGGYLVRQPLLAPGAATYYLPTGALLADNSGYRVALDAASPTLSLDLYNLAPAFAPPPPAFVPPPLPPAFVPLPTPPPGGAPLPTAPPVAAPLPTPMAVPVGGTGGVVNQ